MREPMRASGARYVACALVFCAVMAAAGCAQPQQTAQPEPSSEAPSAVSTTPPPQEPASEIAWLDVPLTDAVTGETFTLADNKGKPVLLHAFAVW